MKLKAFALLLLVACGSEPIPAPIPLPSIVPEPVVSPTPEVMTKERMIELGQKRYQSTCLACHGDPKVGKTTAPPNWGSSEELLRAKVLSGTYPTGYTPKRKTKSMPRFPHLSNDIPNLYEYLNN